MKKLIALTSAMVTGSAFAALSSSAAVSTSKVKSSGWEDFKEKSHISYFAEATKNTVSEESSRAYYYQSISARYKLTDTWTARADLRFSTEEANKDPYSESNPRIGIQGVTYANGNFSVFTVGRLEIAATDGDIDADKMVKPKLYNAANYTVGANSFSAGVELAKWIYQGDAEVPGMSNFMDATYRHTFNDDVAFQVYYELGLASRAGKALGDVTNTWERTLTGVDFSVAKNIGNVLKDVTIYPHVIYQTVDTDETIDNTVEDLGVGAWISASFFR